MEYIVFGFVISLFLLSLSPAPKSTVILLPDEDGQVGEVSISNKNNTQIINTAYTAVAVQSSESQLALSTVNPEEIKQRYQATLSAKPNQVTNYILYFVSGSSDLTKQSRLKIPDIISDINSRKVSEAFIVGHTDTVGGDEQNHRLGLQRANILKTILEQEFFYKGQIQVNSHGEGSPLIVTADNIDEPKNRRVEIEIH